jgi:hypothetical protein
MSSGKQIWLITYGSSCQSITHEMLLDCGLQVDECYTAVWRESKYTLVHIEKAGRLRKTAMDKIMLLMHATFQIVETEIFGFDSVSCNSKSDQTSFALEEHPGFRILVDNVNKDPIELDWWMRCEAEDLYANRKSLLWKHIERTDATSMTHAQLVDRVKKWAPLVQEVAELRQMNSILSDHNATLTSCNCELVEALHQERVFNHEILMKRISPDDARMRLHEPVTPLSD